MRYRTIRNYDFGEVTSAMQKAIRRGDGRLAGYWAIELFDTGYRDYVWRRLLIISAEDCFQTVTQEITALREAGLVIRKNEKSPERSAERLFIVKAALTLARCPKSRDADHLICLVYEPRVIGDDELNAELEAARGERVEVPDYALDCHTNRGKKLGKTKRDFFLSEHDALNPRTPGLFDGEIEKLRTKGE